jgi:hypothetical protein
LWVQPIMAKIRSENRSKLSWSTSHTCFRLV